MRARVEKVDVLVWTKSTEVSLEAHSEMVNKGADHQPVVIFTKYNMDADKPVTVVNLPPVMFKGSFTRQARNGIIQGSWDPERSVAVITMVGIPVDEVLHDIGTKSRNVVIHIDCDG